MAQNHETKYVYNHTSYNACGSQPSDQNRVVTLTQHKKNVTIKFKIIQKNVIVKFKITQKKKCYRKV
jgi:hypothetical protein